MGLLLLPPPPPPPRRSSLATAQGGAMFSSHACVPSQLFSFSRRLGFLVLSLLPCAGSVSSISSSFRGHVFGTAAFEAVPRFSGGPVVPSSLLQAASCLSCFEFLRALACRRCVRSCRLLSAAE